MKKPKKQRWDVIEMLAKEHGVSSEAVRKWKFRQKIPHKWRITFFISAQKRNIDISLEDFECIK